VHTNRYRTCALSTRAEHCHKRRLYFVSQGQMRREEQS